jgi:hypothetical protein
MASAGTCSHSRALHALRYEYKTASAVDDTRTSLVNRHTKLGESQGDWTSDQTTCGLKRILAAQPLHKALCILQRIFVVFVVSY